MTKTTLFTAASVAAILFAGAAQAGEISGTIAAVGYDEDGAYTLASELTLEDAVETAGNTFAVNYNVTDAGITVAAAATEITYRLTFSITGGEFLAPTTSAIVAVQSAAAAPVGATITFTPAGRTAQTISYLVTVTGGTAASTINSFNLTTGLSVEDKTGVTVAGSVSLLAGGVVTQVDGTETDVVDFASAVGAFSADDTTATADLPDFTTFNGGNDDAVLAFNLNIANTTGDVYADLAGNEAEADDVIDAVTVTISGSQFDELTPTLGAGVLNEETLTGSTAEFEFASVADLLGSVFVIENEDEARIQPGEFTATATYEYADGFTGAATAGPIDFGAIELDGTNFIAPWVSGSQAQSQSTLRLSNTAASPAVVSLRLTNGVFLFNGAQTAFPDADCATGALTLNAAGDLTVTPAVMSQCFGAFLRGDLLVTVQAEDDTVTAKVRNSNAQGTFETSLGRYSGSSDAPQ